jgi:hypothetical protein
MESSDSTVVLSSEFFKELEVDGKLGHKRIKIAIKPLTGEESRQAYPYRPFSKYAESRFGGDTYYDDVCLVLNGLASRCKMCQAPTKNKFLHEGICPDCDGRAEYNGKNPHQ